MLNVEQRRGLAEAEDEGDPVRINHVTRSLGSGLAVYLVVAACGTGVHLPAGGGAFGDSGVASDGASLLDALVGPVPDAHADPNTSGSRLKARRFIGDDGSSQFVGWHDSQLNLDCGFGKAADGAMRCLPSASPGILFSDSSCQSPIFLNTKGCAPPAYVAQTIPSAAACAPSGGTRILKIGTIYNGTDAYLGSPSSCTSASGVLPSYRMTSDLYTAGSEVDATMFAKATEQVDK